MFSLEDITLKLVPDVGVFVFLVVVDDLCGNGYKDV